MVQICTRHGQLRLNLQRLKALGFQTPPALAAWLHSLPPFDEFPIIFTDTMVAISHEWNHTLIKVGSDSPEELTNASRTLPLQLFVRRRDKAPEVKIFSQDGEEIIVEQASEIEKLIGKP